MFQHIYIYIWHFAPLLHAVFSLTWSIITWAAGGHLLSRELLAPSPLLKGGVGVDGGWNERELEPKHRRYMSLSCFASITILHSCSPRSSLFGVAQNLVSTSHDLLSRELLAPSPTLDASCQCLPRRTTAYHGPFHFVSPFLTLASLPLKPFTSFEVLASLTLESNSPALVMSSSSINHLNSSNSTLILFDSEKTSKILFVKLSAGIFWSLGTQPRSSSSPASFNWIANSRRITERGNLELRHFFNT